MMADAALERGRALRRRMFGGDGGEGTPDAFLEPLQHMVTKSCFGELWHRPHLDFRMRSMLTVAVLAAMGKPEQLQLHVRGALANGVSPDEIREILLHVAAYAGLPAAAESFGAAAAVLRATES